MKKNIHAGISSFLITALLVTAPVFYSAATASTLMFSEITGLLLLLIHFSKNGFSGTPYRPVAVSVWLSLCLTLVYLLPLPADLWALLPGRNLYADAVGWLQAKGFPVETHLSLIPDETNAAFLFLIPVLAVFFSTSSLPARHIRVILMVFLGLATLEAALGLIQYASNNPAFFLGITPNGQNAQGTYLNPDHFAALMEMAFPMAIGLTLYTLGQWCDHDDTWLKLNKTIIFSSLTILILLGGIFSRSRAGVSLMVVAVFLSSIAFARHIGGQKSASITSVLSIIAGGIAITIGLIPIFTRFVAEDPLADNRWEIFSNTMTGIKTFFPFGAGPGTFPDIYRKFQPLEQLQFINHAHNDYLELVFDMGLSGIIIIMIFMAVYIYGWIKLWNTAWNQMHLIQVSSGIAILLILLHSLVDFNLHNLANAISFGFIAGLFFHMPAITPT